MLSRDSTARSHNLALLLLKTSPGSGHARGGMKEKSAETYENQWRWEKVTDSGATLANGSVGSGGSNGWVGGDGSSGVKGGGRETGKGGGKSEVYRWRHTEAVRLLERALAVHREVSHGRGVGEAKDGGIKLRTGQVGKNWCENAVKLARISE